MMSVTKAALHINEDEPAYSSNEEDFSVVLRRTKEFAGIVVVPSGTARS
jgi:hypothetical protein